MTPAEKAKLYEAIGYVEGENAPVAALPPNYVAHLLEFTLKNLSLHVKKRTRGGSGDLGVGKPDVVLSSAPGKYDDVLLGELHDVLLKVTQVPASSNTK
jgi:hypothetical protein